MTSFNKILLAFWYVPVLGILSAVLAFLFGMIGLTMKGGKPIGKGLALMANFLLNPLQCELTKYNSPPFNREPDWIHFKTPIRILFYPFETVLGFLLLLQGLLLFVSVLGIPVGKKIATLLPFVYAPELIKRV
jgi:hypothetical protein